MQEQFPAHWPTIVIKKNKNQVNLRLSIRGSRILVSGPWHVKEKELTQFAKENAEWIEKTLAKKAAKQIQAVPEELEQKLFLGGKWIPFELETHASNRVKIDPESGIIKAQMPYSFEKSTLKEIKEILYRYIAQVTLPKEFKHFAEKNGFTFDRLFIRSQKTKWGTCSSQSNISFNWRLIKCPLEIRYYLYAHEASHLVHLNHSKNFWDLVKVYDPEYKEHEKWLKKNEQFLFGID